jgi:hypothetical protein
VVPPAVEGIGLPVVEGVVHPAHVPLVREAEAAVVDRLADAAPGRRLLGDGEHAGVDAVHQGVEVLEEGDGLEVLVAAVHVGRPLAGPPGVVPVEHRGHGVDAQAVEVQLAQPEQGVGEEEGAHLGPAVVEHEGAPVRVLAPAGVAVLVERSAVEAGQAPLVAGEVGGHPVDDHPDAALVEVVDEPAEVVGVAEARGRREVPGDLVAPGGLEGVLGDGQQLDVGEPEVAHVVGQQGGQLPVGQEPAVGPAAPRPQVHLVDAEPVAQRVPLRTGRHPLPVGPLVSGREGDAGHAALVLGQLRHGVAALAHDAVGALDRVLVPGQGADALDHAGPDPRAGEALERVVVARPGVPLPHHVDRAGMRRPHREGRDVAAVDAGGMGAQHLPQALVASLGEQPQVVGRGQGEVSGEVGHQVHAPAPTRRSMPAAGMPTWSGRYCSS